MQKIPDMVQGHDDHDQASHHVNGMNTFLHVLNVDFNLVSSPGKRVF
jgi:hypothetical protein